MAERGVTLSHSTISALGAAGGAARERASSKKIEEPRTEQGNFRCLNLSMIESRCGQLSPSALGFYNWCTDAQSP
jgi:hypothetical protein